MDSEIQSYNTRQQRLSQNRHFFLPSTEEIVLYLIIAFLLLSLIEIADIWNYFNQTVIGVKGGFSAILSANTPLVDKTANFLNEGTPLQFLFWFIFGALFYALIWSLKTIFINFRNDMVIGKYYVQSSSAKKKFLVSAINRRVFFVLVVLIMGVFIFKTVKAVTSLAGLYYEDLLPSFHMPNSLLTVGMSILLTAVLIHILMVLFRLVAVSWHYINPF
jgi:hypothetical protein